MELVLTDIQVKIKGLDELRDKFGNLPQAFLAQFSRAGKASAEVVLNVEGTRKYPPTSAANYPPVPYYVRGQGTQYLNHNEGNSEQYGSRFTVQTQEMKTIIGNSASYAVYLADEYRQARVMAGLGWRKLIDAAKMSMNSIAELYSKAVEAALKQTRLK